MHMSRADRCAPPRSFPTAASLAPSERCETGGDEARHTHTTYDEDGLLARVAAMVNASKVLKRRTSKRQTLHDKHKIEKKVREHQRKLRKDRKKNPQKYKRKDPGIPNSWPFKQQLLKQQEEQREAARLTAIEAREAKVRERQRQRQADAALQAASRMTAQQRRELRRRQAAFAPLHDVLADADVVLIVLDARDPAACRSAALEQALLEVGKLPILLLNKSDLVPSEALDAWLAYLGAQLPTLPFSVCCGGEDVEAVAAAAASAAAASKSIKGKKTATMRERAAAKKAAAKAAEASKKVGEHGAFSVCAPPEAVMGALKAAIACRREAMEDAPSELSIGVIGFERAGKRSVIRSLSKAIEAAGDGSGGLGEGVTLLKRPALLTPVVANSISLNDVLLRKAIAEHVPQPEAVCEAFLERCDRRSLLMHFGVADFGAPHEFLESFAEKFSLPMPRHLPGGAVDARAAALGLLKHLSAGRALFCTALPAADDDGEAGDGAAAAPMSAELMGTRWRAKATREAIRAAARATLAGGAAEKATSTGAAAVELSAGAADEIDLDDPEDAVMYEEGDSEEEEEEGESGEEEDEEEGEEEDDDEDEDEDEDEDDE